MGDGSTKDPDQDGYVASGVIERITLGRMHKTLFWGVAGHGSLLA